MKELTKAQLIEKLKNTVSIEKYNKLEGMLKVNKEALQEQKLVVQTLKEQVEMQKTAFETNLGQAKMKFEAMKRDIDYHSNVLSKEYELAQLLMKKEKQSSELFTKMVELYHEAIFENKEEKNTQESEK